MKMIRILLKKLHTHDLRFLELFEELDFLVIRADINSVERQENAQAKSARRAWSIFMIPQTYQMFGGRGSNHGFSPPKLGFTLARPESGVSARSGS